HHISIHLSLSLLTAFYIFFFFSSYCAPRDLHSFPTRRSSDLSFRSHLGREQQGARRRVGPCPDSTRVHWSDRVQVSRETGPTDRSEEHTSELQSLRHLVCRLLLEKKKKKKIKQNTRNINNKLK